MNPKYRSQPWPIILFSFWPISELRLCDHRSQPITAAEAVSQFLGPTLVAIQFYTPNFGHIQKRLCVLIRRFAISLSALWNSISVFKHICALFGFKTYYHLGFIWYNTIFIWFNLKPIMPLYSTFDYRRQRGPTVYSKGNRPKTYSSPILRLSTFFSTLE